MFTDNPFLAVADFLPPRFMQIYVVLMALAVIVGTVADIMHKRSAEFFAQARRRAEAAATRRLTGGERASLATRTLAREVAASGEFCNPQRRASHLLMSWGFVIYVVTTALLVYAYPTDPDPPALVPFLWHLGVVMILVGGYWFFFLLRVDVAHDGKPAWALGRADLFIGSLLASVTAALLFALAAATGSAGATRFFFVVYLAFTTLLFGSVFWSKFAHMFYKPVVAFQKRVEEADGSTSLPIPRGRHGH